jgi:hypothetical protein
MAAGGSCTTQTPGKRRRRLGVVTVGAAILAYGVPAVAFGVIYALGQKPIRNSAEVRARWIAHLAFASPPLFTAVGVVLYLLHSSSDPIVWVLIWMPIGVARSPVELGGKPRSWMPRGAPDRRHG